MYTLGLQQESDLVFSFKWRQTSAYNCFKSKLSLSMLQHKTLAIHWRPKWDQTGLALEQEIIGQAQVYIPNWEVDDDDKNKCSTNSNRCFGCNPKTTGALLDIIGIGTFFLACYLSMFSEVEETGKTLLMVTLECSTSAFFMQR